MYSISFSCSLQGCVILDREINLFYRIYLFCDDYTWLWVEIINLFTAAMLDF
jgi:hypothetical protein